MTKYTLLLFTLLLAVSCATPVSIEGTHATVSIDPLRYVVNAVTEGDIHVTTLTPRGGSPETYQPTPAQIAALSESSVYIRVGTLGFEQTRLRKITENMPHLFAVNASDGIAPLTDTSGEDPHTWMSPRSMRIMAKNIAKALCTIDTAEAVRYAAASQRLILRLDSLDRSVRQRTAAVTHRTFLINHPALGYFARDYGFRCLAIEHDGKEASARRIADLTARCREEGVRIVFVQTGHSAKEAHNIARAIDARVVEIDPLAYDWEGEIEKIVNALAL